MYAVIETGGKQVRCEVGQSIYVEKIEVAAGENYTFDKILMVGGEKTIVGEPYIAGASVVATVEKQGRGKKIIVFKMKQKKKYRRKKGHRQSYTKLLIQEINA